MAVSVPRDFLYLDTSMVDEWLSQQQGGLLDGPYNHKETNTNDKEGGGNIGIPGTGVGLRGGIGVSTSREVEGTYRETPESRFDRLYQLLDNDSAIQNLTIFDTKRFEAIRLGQVVEVAGKAQLTELERMSLMLAELEDLRKRANSWGMNLPVDPQTEQIITMATDLVSTDESKGTLLIIKPSGVNTGGVKYVAKLKPSAIRVNKDDLEGEVLMLGKFIERMDRGQRKPVKELLPHLMTTQSLNHDQRRALAKQWKSGTGNTPLAEAIAGPAMYFRPVAIYQ
jgi:hypothetical protein